MTDQERLRMRTKLAFGVGSVAEAGTYIAFNTFNFLFYNRVLGLSGTLCGLAVTLALVIDAVMDPTIGFLSDRWRGKLGRRHPFLYAAPLPVAVFFIGIYNPPEGLSDFPLFLWFTAFTLLFRQAVSLYHVPHLALGAELSNDYYERSIVMSYNTVFAVVGGAGAFFFGWTLITAGGGSGERAGYANMATIVGLAAGVIIFLSAHFTRDQIPRLPKAPENPPKASLALFFSEVGDCLRNRNYRMTLLGLLCLSATTGTRETLSSYVSLFFWELPEETIRRFAGASPLAFIASFFLAVRLHRKFEKRITIMGAGVLLVSAACLPIILRTLGVMPENGSPRLFSILFGFVFLFYLGSSTLMISVLSALADIADEHELNTGKRQEGMFFAARTFFQQVSSGFGHIIAGVAIDVIGFPTGAKVGEVPHDVVMQLGWIEGPLGAIPALLGIYFYSSFRLSRAQHAEIQRELVARRGRKAESTSAPAAPGALPEPAVPA